MPVIEYKGVLKITVGMVNRAAQIDLFTVFQESEWQGEDIQAMDNLRFVQRIMATDAMVAAIATRKIEVCKKGKWVALEDGQTHTIILPDGDELDIAYPPTYEQINHVPKDLGDEWVKAAVERNGSFSANMNLFLSVSVGSGMTNSVAASGEPPSLTPPEPTT
jgi:hypothetical protein